MDASYEEKMYRQIEKSLSGNINDKFNTAIDLSEKSAGYKNNAAVSSSYKEDFTYRDQRSIENWNENELSANQVENSRYQQDRPPISRAEYIRLAREACLKQLNALEYSPDRDYSYIGNEETHNSLFGRKKKDKVARLFQEGKEVSDSSEELAAYKSLIIRTVCAAVIFLSIFLIDKIKLEWGKFSYETIRQYVTGNNHLKTLEEIIVSWLK